MKLDHSLIGRRKFFYSEEGEDEAEDDLDAREPIYYQIEGLVYISELGGMRFQVPGWGSFTFTSVRNDGDA